MLNKLKRILLRRSPKFVFIAFLNRNLSKIFVNHFWEHPHSHVKKLGDDIQKSQNSGVAQWWLYQYFYLNPSGPTLSKLHQNQYWVFIHPSFPNKSHHGRFISTDKIIPKKITFPSQISTCEPIFQKWLCQIIIGFFSK